MDLATDILLAVTAVVALIVFKQRFELSLSDLGQLSVRGINAITNNAWVVMQLIIVLLISRTVRSNLNTNLGLTDTSFSLSNPVIYLRLLLSLSMNFLTASLFFLLKGTAGSTGDIEF